MAAAPELQRECVRLLGGAKVLLETTLFNSLGTFFSTHLDTHVFYCPLYLFIDRWMGVAVW